MWFLVFPFSVFRDGFRTLIRRKSDQLTLSFMFIDYLFRCVWSLLNQPIVVFILMTLTSFLKVPFVQNWGFLLMVFCSMQIFLILTFLTSAWLSCDLALTIPVPTSAFLLLSPLSGRSHSWCPVSLSLMVPCFLVCLIIFTCAHPVVLGNFSEVFWWSRIPPQTRWFCFYQTPRGTSNLEN